MFNSIAEEGQAAIRVVSTSQHGLTRKLLTLFDISAGTEASKTIPVVDLGLTTDALDYSGVLQLAANVTFANGARDDTADELLYFHPESGGWRIYDQAKRGRDFDRGALTARGPSPVRDGRTDRRSRVSRTHDGRGVELDWLRQLWDVHTNQTGSPSFTDMANWVRDASSWNKRKAYTELDKEADTVGGTLDQNWDNTKLVNQVNH